MRQEILIDQCGKIFGLRCHCSLCEEALNGMRKKPNEKKQILEWLAQAHLDLTSSGYEPIGSGKDDVAILWAK